MKTNTTSSASRQIKTKGCRKAKEPKPCRAVLQKALPNEREIKSIELPRRREPKEREKRRKERGEGKREAKERERRMRERGEGRREPSEEEA